MARMLKLTIAPSGTLVYRATGKAYRGSVTVRDGRVYGRTGRLIGYLGKPTAKQQRDIDRLDRRRQAERRRRELDRRLSDLDAAYYATGVSAPGESIPITFGLITRRQLTEINFAHFLSEAVKDGKMTQKEARDRLEKYLSSETSEERTGEWDDLKGRFKELGFPYP